MPVESVPVSEATAGTLRQVAVDRVGGFDYQMVKVQWGADGAVNETTAATPLPVGEAWTATSALSNVAASTSSVTVLAANTARVGAIIHNDSTATLRLAYAATASATSFTIPVPAGNTWVMSADAKYRGQITGIWETATGTARVTELTA